jgi:hypothetical protein
VEVVDIPAAIVALQTAMKHQDERDAQAQQVAQARGEDTSHEGTVSLRQRVVPFIAMLQRSLDEQHPIVWGV